jgi:hypothetical protein
MKHMTEREESFFIKIMNKNGGYELSEFSEFRSRTVFLSASQSPSAPFTPQFISIVNSIGAIADQTTI